MVTQTTSVPLGTQLATFNAFCAATSPVNDYAKVIETWNAMRRLVLPQNDVPIDAFGGLPTDDDNVAFFSTKVHRMMFKVLGRRVEELARGVVSKDLCKEHRITPQEITRYGTMGLLPLNAVQAFNTSAAAYLSHSLNQRGVILGHVISSAIEFFKYGKSSGDEVERFVDAVGYGNQVIMRVGAEIEWTLRLLIHYGPGATSSFFERHCINTEILNHAVEQQLISEESAIEFCNAHASSVHKVKRHQRILKGLGISGVIPSGYLLGAFLMSKGLNIRSMLNLAYDNPAVSIPLFLCTIIFGLMAWCPDLFIRE